MTGDGQSASVVARRRPNPAWAALLFVIAGYFLWFEGTGVSEFRLRLVSTLLIELIGLAALSLLIRRGDLSLQTVLDWPLAAAALALVVTTVTSSDPRLSLEAWPVYLGYLLVFYAVVAWIRAGWPREWLLNTLLAVSVIPMLVAFGEVWSWLATWKDIGHVGAPPVPVRVTALTAHPNYAAAVFNILLPIALSQWLLARRASRRWLLSLWCLGALTVIYFTSSRGGWIATAAAIGVWGLGAIQARSGLRTWGARAVAAVKSRRWLLAVGIVVAALGLLAVGSGLAYQARHSTHGPLFQSRDIMWIPARQMFLASPFVGVGPRMYGLARLAFISSPPFEPYAHAHNYVINLAAEQGVVGLAAFLWLCLAVLMGLWRAWRSADKTRRVLLAGGVAALVGLALHSLFDMPTSLLPIGMMATVVAALCVADVRVAHPAPRRFAVAWLAFTCVVVAGLSGWSLWAHSAYSAGATMAGQGDWQGAAGQWELAAQRDPAFALYHLQAGLAHANLYAATSDPAQLAAAIQSYEAGLALEPRYAVNHANLAALYWAAGRRAEALGQMEQAHTLAPGDATLLLNLGLDQELLGDAEQAAASYTSVLGLRPDWADAYFWRTTPLRTQALAKWQAEMGQPPGPGWKELAQGQPAQAAQRFAEMLKRSPDSTTYYGWGKALMASGDSTRAEYAFKVAGLAAVTGEERLRADLALTELYFARGDLAQTIASGERSWTALQASTLFGPGTAGLLVYQFRLFERESVTTDVAPQLARIEITDAMANQLELLADSYERTGDKAKARSVYEQVLQAVPDLESARQRLEALEQAR